MDGLRYQFLASTALAADHNGCVCDRNQANGCKDLLHLRAHSEYALKCFLVLLLLQPAVLLLQLIEMQRPGDKYLEFVEPNWFAKEVVGTPPNRLQGVLTLLLSGGDNHLGQDILVQESAERAEAFLNPLRVGWQAEIQGDHRGTYLTKHGKGTGPILRYKDLKVLGEGPLHLRAGTWIIIHDEEFGRHTLSSLALQEDPEGTPLA